jgi:hypothetical protein
MCRKYLFLFICDCFHSDTSLISANAKYATCIACRLLDLAVGPRNSKYLQKRKLFDRKLFHRKHKALYSLEGFTNPQILSDIFVYRLLLHKHKREASTFPVDSNRLQIEKYGEKLDCNPT